ncbi:MAG: hypothetical protein O2909_04310 [Chloroflexi bacterium]|nr:hypothetical protein [Chloroflexota bacterium]MDA1218645.1 hypothetical protein [Chloroflexota bacterium]
MHFTNPVSALAVQGNRILPRGARVTPAKAGVQFHSLDSGFRRNDEFGHYGSDITGVASGLSAFKERRLPWLAVRPYLGGFIGDSRPIILGLLSSELQ